LLVPLVLALPLLACTPSSAPEAASSGAAGPPANATTTVAAPTRATASTAPAERSASKPDDTLFGLLGVEAMNRPKIEPNADDVYRAFERAGYAVGDRKQSLGRTYQASYCTGGYTKDGSLAIDLCEYPDDAAAIGGLARAKTLFPGMTSRTVVGRKATLLTIINQRGDAAADARAKRVAAVYASL
jgi:hypothetical protein